MYQLLVFYEGDKTVRETHVVARAPEVLTLIPKLLADHEGCERIVVMNGGLRLFSVDCAGNTLP